ncbi:MAG: patatin-like phospholipase family protein [Rhizobiales bacterium]|nr:patatin-like phospholipase family protein [Hyphomicrobiales bacterium]MBN9008903.1 patatin-like phospholipase family protein [Hyphomicrobiales bacterium]
MDRQAAKRGVGLALGGGSARGFAHVAVLQALDEMGVRPAAIAGTSMGGIIGAAYAAGMTGNEISDYVAGIFRTRSEFLARLWQLRPRRFNEIAFGFGQLNLERALDIFMPEGMPATFAELRTPLRVVATDYYAGDAATIDEGPLFPALAASAAIPILFRPVTVGGRVMVDGGICNPVPFDQLHDCGIVIAVDVLGNVVGGDGTRTPGAFESAFGAVQLFQCSLFRERLKGPRPPEILIRPPTGRFGMLDFTKAAAIMAASEPVKDEVKRKLHHALAAAG